MIKIRDLEKIYRTEEVETVALNKISIDVKEGEFVAIMGPSGCGKSTLLNILGLLDDPDNGSFLFNNIEVCYSQFFLHVSPQLVVIFCRGKYLLRKQSILHQCKVSS